MQAGGRRIDVKRYPSAGFSELGLVYRSGCTASLSRKCEEKTIPFHNTFAYYSLYELGTWRQETACISTHT
jgi:hypothetical protein